MVGFISFAGGKIFLIIWRRGIGDLAVDGGGILLQEKFDGFCCISRQTVAGFQGVIEGIAENNRAIFRCDGQVFLNGDAGVKSNAFTLSQRALGAEDGIEGVVACIDGRRGLLKLINEC